MYLNYTIINVIYNSFLKKYKPFLYLKSTLYDFRLIIRRGVDKHESIRTKK